MEKEAENTDSTTMNPPSNAFSPAVGSSFEDIPVETLNLSDNAESKQKDPAETQQETQQDTEERPKRKEISKRAKAWDHFILYIDEFGKPRAKCKHCGRTYAADPAKNGTSGMNSHLKVCKKHPDNIATGDNHTIQSYCQSATGGKEMSSSWKFDYEAVRKALARMTIVDELPFKFVENEGFRHFMSVVCPQFHVPSRTTITRDCYKLYFDEKTKLKNYFKKSGQRLSLTTDTWTSNQRLTYMALTGHFIDEDWKLHKIILNFIPCPSHKGDEVGLLIEKCLLDWGVDKIFTITVDNASSNDTTVAYLRRRLTTWGTSILGGKYLHMRCLAHIVALVVRDGLKEMNKSVERVRTAVRYVKQSPVRLRKFNNYVAEEKVQSKKSLCLDVPTRWNSVYMMLETALIYQGVFDRYEICDADFRADFTPGGSHGDLGLPSKEDWDMVDRLVTVLQHFYELTLRVSGSLFVTSNTFLDEISDIDDLLKEWFKSGDDVLIDMAKRMKLKFDKYWGNISKMNMMLYVAVMLDPRHKLEYVEYVFKNMYGEDTGQDMLSLAKKALYDVFEEYKELFSGTLPPSRTSSSSPSDSSDGSSSPLSEAERERRAARAKRKKYHKMISEIGKVDQSEVDMYLHEGIEKDSDDFEIIEWWKMHSPRFPILSRLARDLLAMPVSTVASESAFSTGGRIIDDFRSSLTPKMAQALICCQDWLRRGPIKSIEEEYEFIQKIEEDLASVVGMESNIIGL